MGYFQKIAVKDKISQNAIVVISETASAVATEDSGDLKRITNGLSGKIITETVNRHYINVNKNKNLKLSSKDSLLLFQPQGSDFQLQHHYSQQHNQR